ncbi:hypothetical protein [Corynebacterium sp.]|uniref:hypothetical protein n=1 Tax=Corynebacterium sp. TaxID=1720 RepID=UPI0026DAA92B|nr:hypothetical protein [Corynebacterium sp.]MDO5077437.1 hypothetical protein [Corynebacterium sp.]
MDFRTPVYSPLQHAAVWLGGWLHGRVAFDDLTGAFVELFGAAMDIELLREIRAVAPRGEPALRLALSGPGEPTGLAEGAALLVGRVVLSPITDTNGVASAWNWREHSGPVSVPYCSPGEAERALMEATRAAAEIISRTDAPIAAGNSNPRQLVRSLGDHYDVPGLPACTPQRAEKLFARADSVAAIVEAVHERYRDHRFDPQLIGLWRHIRHARIAGVDYAISEFSRA